MQSFIMHIQGDVSFSANNWNKLFEGNTIDVYEWVESQIFVLTNGII